LEIKTTIPDLIRNIELKTINEVLKREIIDYVDEWLWLLSKDIDLQLNDKMSLSEFRNSKHSFITKGDFSVS
jgi:hypothetical protein